MKELTQEQRAFAEALARECAVPKMPSGTWNKRVLAYHGGRGGDLPHVPGYGHGDAIAIMRQIRNTVTADPAALLRMVCND